MLNTKESIMNNWVGAKWWKTDFHLHTPASLDFGKGPNQVELKRTSPKEYLLKLMDAKLDCVVITDHNSGSWVDKLKASYNELKVENPDGFREIYIFPGVEITVSGGVHILAVLDLDKTTSDIDSLLGELTYRGTKGNSDSCTEKSLIEAIRIISSFGAIPIPAHVDDIKGVFKEISGTTLEQLLNLEEIYSMEISDLEYQLPELYNSTKASWVKVYGTDSHHFEGIDTQAYPGKKYTWVKMDMPTLDGLKLSLLDGDISIKPTKDDTYNPNELPSMFIKSLKINKAKYIGRVNQFAYNSNPWLNTIIGGRGTGKSTIIEFIRTVTNRRNELPSTLLGDFEKYISINWSREDDGLLTEHTEFILEYFKNNTLYSINFKDATYEIKEYRDGELIESVGDVNQRFPVRIYSQKQIFEMAKDPRALLKILDESEVINYHEWEREYNLLISSYMTNRAKWREQKGSLIDESRVQGELEDINKKIEIIEKLGHTEVLNNYQASLSKEKIIEDDVKSVDSSIQLLSKVLEDMSHKFSTTTDSLLDEEIEKRFDEINVGYSSRLEEVKSNILTSFSEYKVIVDEWKKYREESELMTMINANKALYHELNVTLKEAGITNITDLTEVFKLKQEKIERLESISIIKNEMDELNKQSEEIIQLIIVKRSELTLKRQELLEGVLRDNEYVKIAVIPFGSTRDIVKELRLILNKENGYEKDFAEPGLDDGILTQFVEGLNNATVAESMKDKLCRIYLGEEIDVKDARFRSHVKGIEPENIDRLKCWMPKDSLKIEYSLRVGEAFRPLNQGSPGQKTAALLAFILSYGNEPLILDQPEDDLDNHLIYNLVVSQLRSVKQSRQVIIVTHNANIVVNGDSENVACLDIVNGQSSIVAQGSLQDSRIREQVCLIMEGGEIAFDKRYERIRLRK
jgi:hypothetical protein